MKTVVVGLIEIYQAVFSFDRGLLRFMAPFGACRFEVSCSEYTKQKIIEQGVLRGSWLGIKRIASCNPWTK